MRDNMKKKLSKKAIEVINEIKKETGNSPDIIIKTIPYFNHYIYVIFNEMVSNRTTINDFILEYFESDRKTPYKKDEIIKNIKAKLPVHKINIIDNYDELLYLLLSGFTIILTDGNDQALAIETKEKLNSGIQESKAETIIKGPKDALTENYQTNIGLIRKKLKTESLWLKEVTVGTRSKNKVGIMYINDIADIDLVNYIVDKIKDIEIDSIPDSNYIMEMISENKNNVFPDYISTERPDLVSEHLLEGKIAIIVENSQYAVIIPAVLIDFLHSPGDYYQKSINVNYTRIIRFLAIIITLLTPAIYIAITTHNHEAIPEKLLISFAAQRDGVPFPTIVEAMLMLITFEILKESDLRIPQTLGSALSIVGALVLGDAAVQAGIVSPIMVIVIAITAITGLIVSYIEMIHGLRWWRILFIIAAASLGIIGIFLISIFLIINLTSIKSFGIPYLSPIAPLNISNLNNSIFITRKRELLKRNVLTAKKNIYRSRGED
jgi:spore germination protein KA